VCGLGIVPLIAVLLQRGIPLPAVMAFWVASPVTDPGMLVVTAGVLEGKHATCYAEVSSELEEAGAKYEDKAVIRDGNLITSRLPEDIPAFSKAVEEALIEMADNRRPSRPRRPGRPSRPDRPSRGPGR